MLYVNTCPLPDKKKIIELLSFPRKIKQTKIIIIQLKNKNKVVKIHLIYKI